MVLWWKSKTFWTVSIVGESVGSLIAYDRFKLKQVRERFIAEAEAMGEEPATESPRKVTVITMAEDSYQLKKIKKSWRQYAVDLFTKAGCDYQLVEVNASTLNKELDRRLPVPDGQVPEAGKAPERIFTAKNWVKPMVHFWMQKLNKSKGNADGDFEGAFTPDIVGYAKALWEERRVEPRNEKLLTDGIVSLDQGCLVAVEGGVREFCEKQTSLGSRSNILRPKLGYIPCDPSPSWYRSIYWYFRKAEQAENIGNAVMEILRDERSTQNSYHRNE